MRTGPRRKDAALRVLNSGLVKDLQGKFQVRLYRMSDHLERIEKLDQLTAQGSATHIGESLKQVVERRRQPAHRRGGAAERWRR